MPKLAPRWIGMSLTPKIKKLLTAPFGSKRLPGASVELGTRPNILQSLNVKNYFVTVRLALFVIAPKMADILAVV